MAPLNLVPNHPEELVDVRRHKETGEPHILTYLGKDFHSKEHTEVVVKAIVRPLHEQIVRRNWAITILAAQIVILVAVLIYR